MKNPKTSTLVFKINLEDFENNEQFTDALIYAIETTLKLNDDKSFVRSMRDRPNGYFIGLNKKIRIEIRNCDC